MTGRAITDWTDRTEHWANQQAIKTARSASILYEIRDRLKNKNSAKADALWDGYWLVKEQRDKYRARVAEQTAPWFGEER